MTANFEDTAICTPGITQIVPCCQQLKSWADYLIDALPDTAQLQSARRGRC
jgi:hypothetical protein